MDFFDIIDPLLLSSSFCCCQFSRTLSDLFQEQRHGAVCKPLDQPPDRTSDEQLAHPSHCEPSGRVFRGALATSPAAPRSAPFIFVRSMPLLISPDSPLPLLTRGRMKRRGTSLLLWLPQRARIKWISHHSDVHVAVCIFFERSSSFHCYFVPQGSFSFSLKESRYCLRLYLNK